MRFTLPYNCYRVMGITGLFLLGYIVVIGIFGQVDISGYLPRKMAASIQEAWPRLPLFAVQKAPVSEGGVTETYYTVPTRQFTPQELARMGQPAPVVKAEPAPSVKPTAP
jgi:hypothetical protein